MKLLFIYNADSGMLNTAMDIGHKLFSPQTYDCFLCSLTHGTFRENPQWKNFRENSSIEMQFLHRDEFEKKYDRKYEYPVILKQSDSLEVALTKETLGSLTSLENLIDAVEKL